jgi:hypothetical protein
MVRKEKPVYASNRHFVVFGLAIFASLIAIYSWLHHVRSRRAEWPEAQVLISEFRTIPVQVLEGKRGTQVVYQAQAHVSYAVYGKQYVQWLPILSPSNSQQYLQFELSHLKSKPCYRHWDRDRPGHAFLTCDGAIGFP